MSWMITLDEQSPESVDAAARDAWRLKREVWAADEATLSAADEQFDAALDAARVLLGSGSMGEGLLDVQLSGHANPHHLSRPGWATDRVSVVVSRPHRAPAAGRPERDEGRPVASAR